MRCGAISYSMIIYNGLTRLWSWFLGCYASWISSHTWASYITMTIVYYSSLAVNVVILRWLSASTLVTSHLSRLRNTRVIDVMDVLFQSICYLRLVLLALSTMLSVTFLCWVLLSLISRIISTLPSPWISLITIKVLFGSLSAHFLLGMFRLVYWSWCFQVAYRSSHTSAWSLNVISVLLNNINSLFHSWWTLAIASSITMALRNVLHVIHTLWIICSVSSIILIVLMGRYVM